MFVEGAVNCFPDSYPFTPALIPGFELGVRHVKGEKEHVEVLSRLGLGGIYHWPPSMMPTNMWDPDAPYYRHPGFPGHINVAVLRAVAGFGYTHRKRSYNLLGFEVRTVGLQIGYSVQHPVGANAHGRQELVDVGVEMGFVPAVAPGAEGRPLRDGAVRRRPTIIAERVPNAEVLRWLRAGRDELEAVAAFVFLARELKAMGAPKTLIGRSLQAADDEVAHALLCLGRASELGAGRVVAQPIQPAHPSGRPVVNRRRALARLAHESWHDGHLNEGRAAASLERRAYASRDDRDARIQHRIAVEEFTHAILGRDIALWCAAG